MMMEDKKPAGWCKSVSALANGTGGTLIFGVTVSGCIAGLPGAEHDPKAVGEQIRTQIDPIPEFNMSVQNVGERTLLALNILPGKTPPYYYVGDGNRIAYWRVENRSVPADARTLKRLILKGSDLTYDGLTSEYDFADYTFTSLKSAYKQRTGATFEDKDFESFGLVASGKLTNAGALLADKSPIKQSRLFCTRWDGAHKNAGALRILDDKEYAGCLLVLLQRGLEFVKHNSQSPWKKTAAFGVEISDYPQGSVTEGLVNALIHRDYLELGSEVHLDIFDDRLEIYSPGGMCDGTMIQNHDVINIPSKRRNPVIADVFCALNYMRRRGSGLKAIREDYAHAHNGGEVPEPEFCSDQGSFFLKLWNRNHTKGANQGANRTVAGERKKAVLKLLFDRPDIKQIEIAEQLSLSRKQVQLTIKYLMDNGYIERTGTKRNSIWKVLTKLY